MIASLVILSTLGLGRAGGMSFGLPTASATDAQKRMVEHARPRLISEKTGVAPGETIWIGVTFDIDDGWHLYWDGQNDSGMPVKGTWTLPTGVTMGDLLWPTPKRGVYPLDVIDYIYEKRVTAISSITVPKDAIIGSKIAISSHLTWLVCQEQCIPGKGDVSIELPIVAADSVKNSADAKFFEEARKTVPTPVLVTLENGTNEPKASGIGLKSIQTNARGGARAESRVTGKWAGDTLILNVDGAQGLVFYPDATCSTMTNAIKQGESKTGSLRFGLEAKEGKPLRASGIVEVRYAEPRKAEYVSIAVLKQDSIKE